MSEGVLRKPGPYCLSCVIFPLSRDLDLPSDVKVRPSSNLDFLLFFKDRWWSCVNNLRCIRSFRVNSYSLTITPIEFSLSVLCFLGLLKYPCFHTPSVLIEQVLQWSTLLRLNKENYQNWSLIVSFYILRMKTFSTSNLFKLVCMCRHFCGVLSFMSCTGRESSREN